MTDVPDIEKYPSAFRAWSMVAILILLYITSLLDRNIVALLGESIRADLGLTDVELSMLYGPAFAVAHAVAAYPLGWAIDRFSRRVVLWAGVTTWSLGTMACGLSQGFLQFFAARSVVGAGEAVMIPANQSILADMFPPERLAFPVSICSLGSKVGTAGSLLIGGALLTVITPSAIFLLPLVGKIHGWQAVLIAVGLPGLLIPLLIFLLPEPGRRKLSEAASQRTGFGHYFAYMRSNLRFFISIHLVGLFTTMTAMCLMVWTPAHFIRTHHLPAAEVGLSLGAVMLISPVICAPIHGYVLDWLFRRGMPGIHMRYLAVVLLVAAVPFAAAFTVGDARTGYIMLALGHAAFAAAGGIIPSTIQLMVPGEMRGKTASGVLLVTTLGAVIGPVLAAWIGERVLGNSDQIGIGIAVSTTLGAVLAAIFALIAVKPLAEAYPAR